MRLSHYLFAFRHKAFSPVAQIDNECSAFIPHSRATYDFPFSLDKLGIDAVPFISPYFLYHYLFGGLSGDSTEAPYIDLFIILGGRYLSGVSVDVHGYFALLLAKVFPHR